MNKHDITWRLTHAATLSRDASLRTQWDALNAQRGDLPFLAADAVCAALVAFGTGAETLAIAEVDQRVVAMFVLEKQSMLRWATFAPSQLPLSAWVAERQFSLQELVASLTTGPLLSCLILSVTKVDPLLCARESDAMNAPNVSNATCTDYIPTAWIDIDGDFDTYWAARGKNLRQNMRKQRNKLNADGIGTRMQVITAPSDISTALARYGALESAGWKAAEGTAIHPDNAQGRFYLQMFKAAAGRGEAVFYEYFFDEQTVAMNLCLLRNRTLTVLKTAYDETIKTLSPAFLLREEELQLFFASDVIRRVEYFGKIMDWHTKLTAESRTIYHFTHYRWAWLKRWAEQRRNSTAVATPISTSADSSASATLQ